MTVLLLSFFLLVSTLSIGLVFFTSDSYAQTNQTDTRSLPPELVDQKTSNNPTEAADDDANDNDDDNKNIDTDQVSKNHKNLTIDSDDGEDQIESEESGNSTTNCPPGMACIPTQPCLENPKQDDGCKLSSEIVDPDVDKDTIPYNSGYNHGCSDAKISDPEERYINQPGKGPNNHTDEFMDGYNDGFDSCSEASPDSQNPIADAGPDKEILPGQSVTLDGRKSQDTDGEIVKYEWKDAETFAPGCSDVTLDNRESPTPDFSASSAITEKCSSYFELEVTDNDGNKDSDRVTITVDPNSTNPENQKPIADAGYNKVVFEGQSITLDGSNSFDPDGNIAKYSWSVLDDDDDCPSVGSLDNPRSPTPRFTAIENVPKNCSIAFELTVTDDDGANSDDYTIVTVKPDSSDQPKGQVAISDIHAIPFNVETGEKFSIDATVKNFMDKPISFLDRTCAATLIVEFNQDVEQEKVNVCHSMQNVTLNPNDVYDISTNDPKYIAPEAGSLDGDATFYYMVNGVGERRTESFSIDIKPQNRIVGTQDDDSIVGTLKDDQILGLGGDDTLNGGDGGNDYINGGSGNDRLFGEGDVSEDQAGSDILIGGSGDDQIHGGPKADKFDCGPGVDAIDDFNPQEGDVKNNNCESF
ncbi:MAG: PKD domain-containing protein [Candidatus Nitrosocosmicus sp.]